MSYILYQPHPLNPPLLGKERGKKLSRHCHYETIRLRRRRSNLRDCHGLRPRNDNGDFSDSLIKGEGLVKNLVVTLVSINEEIAILI